MLMLRILLLFMCQGCIAVPHSQPSVLLDSNGNASPNVTALMMIAAGDEDEDSDQDIDGQPEPLFPKVQTDTGIEQKDAHTDQAPPPQPVKEEEQQHSDEAAPKQEDNKSQPQPQVAPATAAAAPPPPAVSPTWGAMQANHFPTWGGWMASVANWQRQRQSSQEEEKAATKPEEKAAPSAPAPGAPTPLQPPAPQPDQSGKESKEATIAAKPPQNATALAPATHLASIVASQHPLAATLGKVYYINLDKAVERKRFMEGQFEKSKMLKDIGIERITAVDGSQLRAEDLMTNRDVTDRNYDRLIDNDSPSEEDDRLTLGAYGLFDTYYSLWCKTLKGYKTMHKPVMILEDDAQLVDQFDDVFASFLVKLNTHIELLKTEGRPKLHIVYIGGDFRSNEGPTDTFTKNACVLDPETEEAENCNYVHETVGFILFPEGRQVLCDKLQKPFDMQVDSELVKLQREGVLESVWLEPSLVSQSHEDSSVQIGSSFNFGTYGLNLLAAPASNSSDGVSTATFKFRRLTRHSHKARTTSDPQ